MYPIELLEYWWVGAVDVLFRPEDELPLPPKFNGAGDGTLSYFISSFCEFRNEPLAR